MNQYYKNIPSEILFDYEDYYDTISEWLPSGCRIAEVGIADGRSMIYLASKLTSLTKAYTLYAIDNMEYGNWKQTREITMHLMNSKLLNVELMAIDSLNASCEFDNGFFDFVFIDSSHKYEHTKADILLWQHKIKAGGILAGHDYLGLSDVKLAVDEIVPNGKLKIINTRLGHGIWEIML